MTQIAIDMPGCRGVEVENALAQRTTYRVADEAYPVIEVPEAHAALMSGRAGLSRHHRSFAMGVSFDAAGNIVRD